MKSVDKYVYPDTNILINKFDCRDEDKLREIEALSTGGNLAYLQLHPINDPFDVNTLINYGVTTEEVAGRLSAIFI